MALKTKKLLSILLALTVSLSLIPAAFAETNVSESFADFPTGWSKPAMEAAVTEQQGERGRWNCNALQTRLV